MAKGKRLTVRLDDALDAVINQACIDGNCDKSTVVIQALKKGLEIEDITDEGARAPKPTPTGRLVEKGDELGYIAHKSHPSIKLVKQVYDTMRGQTRYRDIEGREWIMNEDKTLTPIAKIHVIERDDAKREVRNPDGSIDVYKNGKLDYKAIPPKVAGGKWTYVLYT